MILILMLIIAMIPTANYTWTLSTFEDFSAILADDSEHQHVRPYPQDHAICFFTHAGRVGIDSSALLTVVRQRVIVSAILIGLGMMIRVWRLFRRPDEVYRRVRRRLSVAITGVLHKILGWTSTWTVSSQLVLIFIYRPLLAIFMTVRILLDIGTSRLVDVLWLLISFCWGTLSLWLQQPLDSSGGQQWTFGQVIALVMSVAPAIALVEGFVNKTAQGTRGHAIIETPTEDLRDSRTSIRSSDKSPSLLPMPVSSAAAPAEPPIAPNQLDPTAIDNPEKDFYRFSDSFSMLVYVTILLTVAACGYSLFVLVHALELAPLKLADPSEPASMGITSTPILVGFLSFCVLISLVLKVPSSASRACYRVVIKPSYFLMYGIILGLAAVLPVSSIQVPLTCLMLYTILSCLDIYQRWRQRKNYGC
jgi:hypothetical protein